VHFDQLKSALRYAWRAKTIYDVHAPLAFSFVGEVVEDERHFYAHEAIEEERQSLLNTSVQIDLKDHGAGSLAAPKSTKTIAEIAKHSATPPAFGRYLAAAVEWSGARNVIELGTNLGIGTSYLASTLPSDGQLISIDADEQLLAIAKCTLASLPDQKPVRLVHGTFEATLPSVLASVDQLDLAFLDGHHEEEATKSYFAQVAAKAHARSVIILDDIHWSAGMEAAWAWVQAQPGVSMTIDLYRWGVVFFDPAVRSPMHITVVPKRYKPWHMGFFSSRVK